MAQQNLPPASEFTTINFIMERRYLKNVTTATLEWYQQAFKAFDGCTTQDAYKQRIVTMRQRGLSPVSINSWLRVVNAYLRWSGETWKLPRLREEQKVLATLTPEQCAALLGHRVKGLNGQRAQVLAGMLLDTGLRISEALSLKRADVDLDNLLIRVVMGKGRKERRVPISLEGRRRLYQWLRKAPALPEAWLFPTRSGRPWSVRNAQRDLSQFCAECGITGIRCSPHTFRHSFACHYLKRNGNLEYLRRILGHASILLTQRYLQSLTPQDLTTVHDGLSPLTARTRP